MTITGTGGNDNLRGTGASDDFDVSQGGDDTLRGKGGDEIFHFGAAYTLADKIDGGSGVDAIVLNGPYNPAVFGANITSIEQITITSDLNYAVKMRDAAVAAGKLMNFDGGTLDVGNHFTLDASAESDGKYFVTGSGGADIIKTGSGNDLVFGGGGDDRVFGGAGGDLLSAGFGSDTVYGGDGSDTILFDGDGAFDSTDRVFGGSDALPDTLELNGNYSGGLTITKAMAHNMRYLKFDAGHDYSLDVNQVDPTNGGPYLYDASALGAGDSLSLDAHAMRNSGIIFYGGDSTDFVQGARGYNDFRGGGGVDVMTANNHGPDVFNYDAVSDSTGTHYDTVVNFDALNDFFNPHVGGVDQDPASFARFTDGRVDAESFNHDLTRNVGAGEMGVDGAVLYRAQNGNLAGIWYLIVDGNSTAGYQANDDIVVRLDGASHLGDFGLDNFGTAG